MIIMNEIRQQLQKFSVQPS